MGVGSSGIGGLTVGSEVGTPNPKLVSIYCPWLSLLSGYSDLQLGSVCVCECVGYWIDKSVVPDTLTVIQTLHLEPLDSHYSSQQGSLPRPPLFFAPSRLMALHLLLADLIAQL